MTLPRSGPWTCFGDAGVHNLVSLVIEDDEPVEDLKGHRGHGEAEPFAVYLSIASQLLTQSEGLYV